VAVWLQEFKISKLGSAIPPRPRRSESRRKGRVVYCQAGAARRDPWDSVVV